MANRYVAFGYEITDGKYAVIPVNAQRDTSREEVLAKELKSLELFKGVSETDFALNRAPSRVEALVMLIRVLGKESEVNGDTWNHPFIDVPDWADSYVGYAYSKGLTKGSSSTQFGTGDANAVMYLTFVLRALGYSDTNGKDFTWDNPYALSRKAGILNDEVNINEFLRADVVVVSHAALTAHINGTQQTLAQKLISAGVFTQKAFDNVYNKNGTIEVPIPNADLTAEEIYAKCSPAVFYIETFDASGSELSSGSGFFIDDKGTAVTNYHVIEDAYTAFIQTSDTGITCEVLGVYDYNKEEDWAILKIDYYLGNSKYLVVDNTTKVAGGQKVYAIGSPLGLQNTISEGIISNPARVDGKTTYIQTNAAISPGSSGGALINKDGKVIGITSAAYTDGQNLNLALPISYINGYDTSKTQSFIYLITGNEKSVVKGYANYPEIPDFGAFNAVEPYKIEKESNGVTTFYYSHDSLKAANTYGAAMALYDEVAKDWGFTIDFFTQGDDFITELKCETATHTHYVYYDFLGSYNGVGCMVLSVYSETKKLAEGYIDDPNVPDFGHYFGVNGKANLSSVASIQCISYYYNVADLYNNGHDNFFEVYADLLEDWGFIYEDKDENNIYRFVNSVKNQTINFSANDGVVVLHIFIW